MRHKHGMTKTRLYRIWRGMLTRCYNTHRNDFTYYGGKGITVCDDWKNSFPLFYEWAIKNGYSETVTLDRKDVNGNYCPENCRWLSRKKQSENRSNNRLITAFGETHTISQWSEITGLKFTTIKGRIDRLGWETEKALSTKSRNYLKGVLNND